MSAAPLRTPRLELRPLALADAPAVFSLLSDPDVARYLMTPLATPRQAESFVRALLDDARQQVGLTWALELRVTPALAGLISYWFRPAAGELNFSLGRAYWGQGLMREALPAVVAYGLGPLGLPAVEADVAPGNQRAAALLAHLSFQLDESDAGRRRWRRTA